MMTRLHELVRRLGPLNAAALGILIAVLLWLIYAAGLVDVWLTSEEYGHGPLVLLVLGYLVYQRRASFSLRAPPRLLALFAVLPLLVFLLGAVIGSPQLQMYGAWLFAVATVAALGGGTLVRQLAIPLLIAFMIIPLPYGLETKLTAQLQLLSSQLGVGFIRLFGGVVYLQGNVIDMGGVKLLVAEACAGLRYLYPLMSLGALAGYLLRAPLWIRWTLFLATVPITVLMNSLRIGITGILVDRFGQAHTEGILHFFEGWIVFVAALLILLLLAKTLLRFQPGSPRLTDALVLGPVDAAPSAAPARVGTMVLASTAVAAIVAALLAPQFAGRAEAQLERKPFVEFPAQIGEWQAQSLRLPSIVETVAGASEYYYADFSSPRGPVNLYVSYYQTQREGRIPHSPSVCIPGDGWTIQSNTPLTLAVPAGAPIQANRLLIQKGDKTMVAYYWLKQGRYTYRSELFAKIDLVRSSVMDRRTDGALVRLVSEVQANESVETVDARLTEFSANLAPVLPQYAPD